MFKHRVPTSCLRCLRYLWGAPSEAAGAREDVSMPRKIRPKRHVARIQSKYKWWMDAASGCVSNISGPLEKCELNPTMLVSSRFISPNSAPSLITKQASLLSTFMPSQERWMTQLLLTVCSARTRWIRQPLVWLSFLVDLFLESMLLASNQCHMLILALNCQLRPRGPLTLCIKTVSECEYMLCWLVVGPHTWNCGNPWGLVHCLGWKRDNIIHPYVC